MFPLVVFGTLFYLEVRTAPRWAVWTTFSFLVLPLFAYTYTCIRVFMVPIFAMGQFHGP